MTFATEADAAAWAATAPRAALVAWLDASLRDRPTIGTHGRADDLLPSRALHEVYRALPALDARAWWEDALLELLEDLVRNPGTPGDREDELLLLAARVFPGTSRAPAACRRADEILKRAAEPALRTRAAQILLAVGERRDSRFWGRLWDPSHPPSLATAAAGAFANGLESGMAVLTAPDVPVEEAARVLARLLPSLRRHHDLTQLADLDAFLGLVVELPSDTLRRLLAATRVRELDRAVYAWLRQGTKRDQAFRRLSLAGQRSRTPPTQVDLGFEARWDPAAVTQ